MWHLDKSKNHCTVPFSFLFFSSLFMAHDNNQAYHVNQQARACTVKLFIDCTVCKKFYIT